MSIRLRIMEPPALCQRCAYGTTLMRAGGSRMTRCSSVDAWVPPDIEACNRYMPMGTNPPIPWKDADARAHIIDPRPDPGQVL